MTDPNDAWYVRLPTGRVMRAKSTAAVRRYIERGRIPVASWVRRSRDEDWATLEWSVEFSDLIGAKKRQLEQQANNRKDKSGSAERKPRARATPELRNVGVRGLVEELLIALDNTLNRRKLLVAALAGFAGSGVIILARFTGPWFMEHEDWTTALTVAVAGLCLLVIVAISTTLVTQMTFVELSSLRQARWAEATVRFPLYSLRLLLMQLLFGGGLLAATLALLRLPDWLFAQNAATPGAFVASVAVAGLILATLLWPIIGLTMLFAPIIVIEDCSVARALRQWFSLVRSHFGRVFLYEALATALGATMTVPFVLAVFLARWLSADNLLFPDVTWGTLCVLNGLAVAPLLAYLAVANVFIYLNLRYEFSSGQREWHDRTPIKKPG